MTRYKNETYRNTMQGCGMHILDPVTNILVPYEVGELPE
jgi:hypothetical protein